MQIKRYKKHAFTGQTSFVYLHLVFNSVEELNATKYDLKKGKKKNYNTKVDTRGWTSHCVVEDQDSYHVLRMITQIVIRFFFLIALC